MKIKFTLVFCVLILCLGSMLLMTKDEVLAGFLGENSSNSLVTYEAYSKIETKRDRIETFARETPKSKSLLWKHHLSRYLANAKLNDKQRDFIRSLSDLLTEEFFIRSAGMSEIEYRQTEHGKAFENLFKDLSGLFSKEQVREVFLVIGESSTITDWGCGKNSGPSDASLNNSGGALPGCNCTGSFCAQCTTAEPYCVIGWPYPICDDTPWGCGCGGFFECTSKCTATQPD